MSQFFKVNSNYVVLEFITLKHTHTHTHIQIYIYTHTYIYIYLLHQMDILFSMLTLINMIILELELNESEVVYNLLLH